MARKTRTIGEYCNANPIARHHQKAGEKVACSSPPMSAGWAWNPDDTTRKALARGQRKIRKAKLAEAEQQEEAKMATNKAKGKTRKTSTKKVTAKKVTAKKTGAKAGTRSKVILISLKKICQKLKIDPKMARRKLRAEGVKGHDPKARWEFTAAQAKKVTTLLSA